MYIQPSFLNSCEEHGLWSGGNDQYRGDRSVDFSTFTKGGRARVEAFSDAALEANKEKRKTSIPLRDRILPQYRRVSVLTEQLIELEKAYKAGEYGISEYSTLRAVLVTKRNRATVLYQKAINVSEPVHEDDEDSYNREEYAQDGGETPYESCAVDYTDTPIAGSSYPSWINELSPTNSLKKPLKIACTLVRKTVQFSKKAKSYYQTLKEV
jgi:hypothetical protein